MNQLCLIAIGLVLFIPLSLLAQDKTAVLDATTRLEKLRSQWRDVKAQEAEGNEQIRKLELEMEPESLQRAFAQTPSLNPTELRENRRRQLAAEKVKIADQLASLAESRINLEKAITLAESELTRLREPGDVRPQVTVKTTDRTEATIITTDQEPVKSPPTGKKKKNRVTRRVTPIRNSVWKPSASNYLLR